MSSRRGWIRFPQCLSSRTVGSVSLQARHRRRMSCRLSGSFRLEIHFRVTHPHGHAISARLLCQRFAFQPSTHSLLRQHFIERFYRAVGEADQRALAVALASLDEPRLSRPAGRDTRDAGKHGRYIVDACCVGVGGCSHSGALPCFRPDAVRLQHTEPKIFPCRTSVRRWALRPLPVVVLKISM